MIAWAIYVTFGGALLLLFLPHVLARWMALLTALTGFAISLNSFFTNPDNATFKTLVQFPWIQGLGFEYHLAVDGISLTMCLSPA
jgi:NADH:ubiquinone oxidoreductase subunit 4 (chain M)